MQKLKSAVSALTIGFLLVISLDYLAFASTGQSLILGKSNSANKATTLTRTTSGPALDLKVKNGVGAPIKVNTKGRVGNFNADLVDGKHAADLGVRTRIYNYNVSRTATSNMAFNLPGVPAGTYLATLDVWIYGPSGTSMHCYLRGGGVDDRAQQFIHPTPGNTFFPISTSGVITVPEGVTPRVTCNSGASGNWTDYNDFQVTFTPIDTLVAGTPVTARPSGKGSAS